MRRDNPIPDSGLIPGLIIICGAMKPFIVAIGLVMFFSVLFWRRIRRRSSISFQSFIFSAGLILVMIQLFIMLYDKLVR
jgi:hypothetical protein